LRRASSHPRCAGARFVDAIAMKHPYLLKTALPESQLRLASFSARLGVSQLDEIELELVSPKPDLAPEDLLGKPMEVACLLRDPAEGLGMTGKRFVGGLCMRFGLGRPLPSSSAASRLYAYSASVRPWLWFLTRTSDCRVFQEMTVPQIVEKVFADCPGADFEFKLVRTYRTRVYCVQYRESDYNFVARLLEDEGIWWYIEHTEGHQKVVLVDDVASLDPVPGALSLPYLPAGSSAFAPDLPHIDHWSFSREVQTGRAALQSYDFERPSLSLLAESVLTYAHAMSDFEHFDYEGESYLKADGEQRATNRVDEFAARHERLAGTTNAQTLACGHSFELERHPRDDQNVKHIVLSTRIEAQAGSLEGGGDGEATWRCSFTAAPASQPMRPARRTPKPFVQGPQTAVVVGPQGEEIFTDKYGRVKIQFHWDRYGQKNEKSSCWVRVSTPWAGKSFGFVQVPRIGQEVVVDFLEGDPDQPIITGRVYNAEQTVPWELPANATQTGVLTRSSKGGAYGNANALRFEDKAGQEQVWLHAEKNQDIEVENDETHWVGHDRTKTIDHDETVHVKHDRTETVGRHETITVGVNRTESVGSNETITIGANRTENVGANETISIGSNRTVTVGGSETATVALQRTHAVGVNESIAIGAAQEVAIGGAQVVAVGAVQSISVGANQSNDIGGNRSLKVGGDQATEVGRGRSTKVGKDDALSIGKSLVIDAGDSVTIKTGEASITMKKDGSIVIKGKDIKVDGSGKIDIKAAGDIVMKGSKIGQN
jgi:type VI secretion system secreted protein VgrG